MTVQVDTNKHSNSIITLPAKPQPVLLDTARCAVIVIDMQNDFGRKGACSTALESTSR